MKRRREPSLCSRLALLALRILLVTDCVPIASKRNDAPKWDSSSAHEPDTALLQEKTPRVGVLVQGPAVKGLFRDAECLVWALARDPVRLNGRTPAELSVFYTANYAMLDMAIGQGLRCMEDKRRGRFCATANGLGPGESPIMHDYMVAEGTDVREWLQAVDVVVVFESVLRAFFAMSDKLGVQRKVLVLNIDWIEPAILLALHSEIRGLQLWTKGNATYGAVSRLLGDHLSREGIPKADAIVKQSVFNVPWSIPDPVLREDWRFTSAASQSSPPAGRGHRGQERALKVGGKTVVRFVFIAGMGGIGNRRGGDVVLKAWSLVSSELARHPSLALQLDFYSVRHPEQYDMPVSRDLLGLPGLHVHVGPLEREVLVRAVRGADAVLYPSRWEGLGLSLLEALHAGVPALVTDGWPMNELVDHGHNGLLVPATQVGTFHMAPVWEVAPGALAYAIHNLTVSPALLERMRCPAPGELAARQHAFVMQARALLLGEPPPRVVSIAAPPHPHYRRAEYLRSDALRRHGYEVLDLSYEDNLEPVMVRGADFALVAKAPSVEWVQKALKPVARLARIPVFMWFWDPIDYGEPRRRWFESVAPLFDVVLLNEKGREGMWACNGSANVHYIEEGVMVEGDRGPGRRPTWFPPPASGADVSFQGTVYPYAPDYKRVRVLLELAGARGMGLEVYGPTDMWQQLNISSNGMSYGIRSSHIHRTSKVSLSLSREQPGVELYRSERLMDGAASGACVLSERFPGLDLLLPPDAVLTADSPREYLSAVAEVVRDPERCLGRRERAATAAWRYHTWDDSVAKFLSLVRLALPRTHAGTRSRDDLVLKSFGLGCDGFCVGEPRNGKERGQGNRRGATGACTPPCGEENYNCKVGALLIGWTVRGLQGARKGSLDRGEAVVAGTAVEAGLYFWAALRECPASCPAWEGLAVSLLAQGDVTRATRSLQALSRLSCPDAKQVVEARPNEVEKAVTHFEYRFGVPGCEDLETGLAAPVGRRYLGLQARGRVCQTYTRIALLHSRRVGADSKVQ